MEAIRLISIIIPIYNSEKFLRSCLNSVIIQTYHNLQIILVDDGSTDKSGRICEEYAKKDSRIIVVHKENGGVSSARNEGLAKVSGDWIAFIDSDDSIEPEYIFEMSKFLEYDLVVSDNKIDTECEYKLDSDFQSYLQRFVHSHNTSWGKIFSNIIIKRNMLQFDERVRFGEDTIFYLSYLSHCNSIKVIPQNAYNYTLDGVASERYNLSIDEVKEMGDKIIQRYDVLSSTFKFEIDTYYDRMQIVSMYPLRRILSEGEQNYFELYSYYFPQKNNADLYQDRLCSPMIRIISYAKSLYENQQKADGRLLLSSAYKMYGRLFSEIRYPYRGHKMIGWLLGRGKLRLVNLLLLCYSFVKQ